MSLPSNAPESLVDSYVAAAEDGRSPLANDSSYTEIHDPLLDAGAACPHHVRVMMIDVAAGLVFRSGRLLITQRPAGGHLGGLWEFPGGKREAQETFAECLARELREELGIEVEVGAPIEIIVHAYPEKTVNLQFFHCAWRRGEPQALGCADFRWVNARDLAGLEFPPADARLIERLRGSPELWLA